MELSFFRGWPVLTNPVCIMILFVLVVIRLPSLPLRQVEILITLFVLYRFGCPCPITLRCDPIGHPLACLLETILQFVVGLLGAGFNVLPSGFGGALGLVELLV